MLVIFEGPDGSGKSLLRREFDKQTNYEHMSCDRMYLSFFVYAQMFGRNEFTSDKARKKLEADFRVFMKIMKPMIVYMKAKQSTLEERIRARGEDPREGPEASLSMTLYAHWIDHLKIQNRVVTIDTTGDPDLDSLVKLISNKIKVLSQGKK